MDSKAKVLAELIDKRGSRRAFAEEIGLPPSTLQSILNRGVAGAAVDKVIKACRVLGITVEQLDAMGDLYDRGESYERVLTSDGEDWTDDEIRDIEEYKKFVRSKRQAPEDK